MILLPSRTLTRRASAKDKPVGTLVQGSGAKRLDGNTQAPLPSRKTSRLGKTRDSQGLGQTLQASGGDPEQVAGGNHLCECCLCPSATLKEPLREITTLAQLGGLKFNRAGLAIPRALSITVATVHPLWGDLPIGCSADPVSLGRHQTVRELFHQVGEHIRACAWQAAPGRAGPRSICLIAATACVLLSVWVFSCKDHAVAVFSGGSPGRSSSDSHTSRPWTCTVGAVGPTPWSSSAKSRSAA
jgi:hypothetical protein